MQANMELSILYFGDVVGSEGYNALAIELPALVEKYSPDLLLANIENISHGRGVHPVQYQEMLDLGFSAFTSGDHVWHFKETLPLLDQPNVLLLRPANYANCPGKGYVDIDAKGKRLRLINLEGRVFMPTTNLDNPFTTFDAIMNTGPKPDLVIVDFHAEATSEKRAFAEYALGRAHLVVGTHTHVPTADAQIIDQKMGFISDLGMNGPHDSCLGAQKEQIIKSFLTGLPWRYNVGEGECELGALYCKFNIEEGKAIEIEHFRKINK